MYVFSYVADFIQLSHVGLRLRQCNIHFNPCNDINEIFRL
jgi:hypothetical protein